MRECYIYLCSVAEATTSVKRISAPSVATQKQVIKLMWVIRKRGDSVSIPVCGKICIFVSSDSRVCVQFRGKSVNSMCKFVCRIQGVKLYLIETGGGDQAYNHITDCKLESDSVVDAIAVGLYRISK